MNPLFLIPARGGSKGVPGKNIRLLAGRPLIVHTIEQALKVADSSGNVVVSTDSSDIAEVSRNARARVPFLRPANLATDTSGSREVMLHAWDFFREHGETFDYIVLLQPTSPLRNPSDIRRAVELYESNRPDMVVSVRGARSNPYYNAFECDDKGYLRISKGDGMLTRRQDAPPVWEFDGSIYVINPEALRSAPSLARMERIVPLPVEGPWIDIDTELDFLVAEHIISKTN